MNHKLHEKWNSGRDSSRGSSKEAPEILKNTIEGNKVLLKQSKPK